MPTPSRVVILGVLILAVAVTVALRRARVPASTAAAVPASVALPRFLEVGSDSCIPCKAMVPVLDELRREYAGRLRVGLVDAWKSPDQADAFRVSVSPTQIFIDASGRELRRHRGFISKAEILETWRQLGVRLDPAGKSWLVTDLLTALTRTLHAAPEVAVMGAFLWGVASILLSPCHLVGVPLLVAYTGRDSTLSTRRAAGRILGAFGGATNYLVAALLFVVGLELLGAWPFRWSGLPRPETTRRGFLGAFVFGLALGTALGPCKFAFLAPVIGLTVQVAATRPVLAILLVLAYALGHCGVLAAAGAGGPGLARYAGWSERGTRVLRRVCGALVLGGGIYLVYSAP